MILVWAIVGSKEGIACIWRTINTTAIQRRTDDISQRYSCTDCCRTKSKEVIFQQPIHYSNQFFVYFDDSNIPISNNAIADANDISKLTQRDCEFFVFV
jgi:hypothetical protein